MRDLGQGSATEVDAERSRVAGEGWGARLLALQGDDGNWGGGAYSPKWTSTTYTLLLMRHFGIRPDDPAVMEAIDRVRSNVVMGQAEHPFFWYVGETCITGKSLALAAYFFPNDVIPPQVEWLLDEQLEDGGWNCQTVNGSTRSSFNTTISVLEGLQEMEHAVGGDPLISKARQLGHEYLQERRLMRALSTGDILNKRWLLFSFPPRWHYDVLRGLDYLRESGETPDPRCEEAIELVASKRRPDGSWPLQNRHPGREHFTMEEGSGKPSRWNTLRALRVLGWHRGD